MHPMSKIYQNCLFTSNVHFYGRCISDNLLRNKTNIDNIPFKEIVFFITVNYVTLNNVCGSLNWDKNFQFIFYYFYSFQVPIYRYKLQKSIRRVMRKVHLSHIWRIYCISLTSIVLAQFLLKKRETVSHAQYWNSFQIAGLYPKVGLQMKKTDFISAQKHRLWVHVRTASAMRF